MNLFIYAAKPSLSMAECKELRERYARTFSTITVFWHKMETTMNHEQFLVALEDTFKLRLQRKTGWGRVEVLIEFHEAMKATRIAASVLEVADDKRR